MGLHDDSEETRRIGIWDTRPRGVVSMTIAPTKCKLAINAMFMAYSAICPSQKSIEDLNTHLAGCLAQDSALAMLEALDILRAGIERGEWFEES